MALLSPTFATKHLCSFRDYRTNLEFLPITRTIIAQDPEVSTTGRSFCNFSMILISAYLQVPIRAFLGSSGKYLL
jgi:hypothetical protein